MLSFIGYATYDRRHTAKLCSQSHATELGSTNSCCDLV